MHKEIINNIFLVCALILAQVLACNHIMLFNVAMAFVFIYFIVRLPMDLNINIVLTLAFFTGLAVDIFSDTPGMNAMACTILAMMRRPLLYAYIPRDDRTKNIVPSLKNLGFIVYGKYLFSMSVVYCLLIFSIEYFSFADVKEIIFMSAASSAFTFLVLLGVDSIIMTNREKRL